MCIATVNELLFRGFGSIGIVDNGLQVALYACHGGLQLVGHILCQLPLQHVLLFLCRLQALIELDNAFSNLAQLIVGKLYKVF